MNTYELEEHAMQWNMPTYLWLVASLVLCCTVLALAQMPSAAAGVQKRPAKRIHVSQTSTVAVCGQGTCDCGAAPLIVQENAPCTGTSSTGRCTTGTGVCCVCAAAHTIAVCQEGLCNCGEASLVAKVGAPCHVTSASGGCRIGSGECCVCATN